MRPKNFNDILSRVQERKAWWDSLSEAEQEAWKKEQDRKIASVLKKHGFDPKAHGIPEEPAS